MSETSHNQTVTKIVDRIPRPGQATALEAAIRDLIACAVQFPGHLGVTVTHPAPPQQPGFRIVYRFDTPEHLAAWEESPVYARLAAVADLHTQGMATARAVPGLEAWFTLPGEPLRAPRRGPLSLVSWLGVFPLVWAGSWLLQKLAPPATPLGLRAAVVTAFSVLMMTYLVAPRLNRLFRRWLYPS